MKQLEKDVDCYIINPDGLKVGAHIRRKVDPRKPHQKRVELDGFSKALAARDDIKMVIIDEAHRASRRSTPPGTPAPRSFSARSAGC